MTSKAVILVVGFACTQVVFSQENTERYEAKKAELPQDHFLSQVVSLEVMPDEDAGVNLPRLLSYPRLNQLKLRCHWSKLTKKDAEVLKQLTRLEDFRIDASGTVLREFAESMRDSKVQTYVFEDSNVEIGVPEILASFGAKVYVCDCWMMAGGLWQETVPRDQVILFSRDKNGKVGSAPSKLPEWGMKYLDAEFARRVQR